MASPDLPTPPISPVPAAPSVPLSPPSPPGQRTSALKRLAAAARTSGEGGSDHGAGPGAQDMRLDAMTVAYVRARLQGVSPKEALQRYRSEDYERALTLEEGFSSREAAVLAAVRQADRAANEALLRAARRLGAAHEATRTTRELRLIPRLRNGAFDVPQLVVEQQPAPAGQGAAPEGSTPSSLHPALPGSAPPWPALASAPPGARPTLASLSDEYPDFSEGELIELLQERLAALDAVPALPALPTLPTPGAQGPTGGSAGLLAPAPCPAPAIGVVQATQAAQPGQAGQAGQAWLGAPSALRRLKLALRAIERLAEQARRLPAHPLASDALGAWLPEASAKRLAQAGLCTLGELALTFSHNPLWYHPIAGFGVAKARWIEAWFDGLPPQVKADILRDARREVGVGRGQEDGSYGAGVGEGAGAPSPAPPGSSAAGPAPSDTAASDVAFAIRPLERFDCPPRLDSGGSEPLRGASEPLRGAGGLHAFGASVSVLEPLAPGTQRPLLAARNDREAIEAWIQTVTSTHSRRAYRKEAERFLLWIHLERGRGVSQATVEDCSAYLAFAKAPPAAWRAVDALQRVAGRNSALWRPFGEHPLSDASLAHARVVLSRMFTWLNDANYVRGNPWTMLQRSRRVVEPLQARERHLSEATRDEVLAWASALPCQVHAFGEDLGFDEGLHRVVSEGLRQEVSDATVSMADLARNSRLRLVLRLLFDTGVRRDELANAQFGDVQFAELDSGEVAHVLRVRGKGQKVRRVPLSQPALEAICLEARVRLMRINAGGVGASPGSDPLWVHPALNELALIANLRDPLAQRVDTQVVYEVVLSAFAQVAQDIEAAGEPERARHLRQATPHWARHTFGTQIHRRGGRLNVIQELLGHASISTTTVYAHVSQEELVETARLAVG